MNVQFISDELGISLVELLLHEDGVYVLFPASLHQGFQLGGRRFLAPFLDAELLQSIITGKIAECRMINQEGTVGICQVRADDGVGLRYRLL